jgi:methylase of polypeptide subunit release factors
MQAWRARLASVSRNARNELRWMVEEVAPGASLRNLSAQQTARLEAMVADRVERRKPLQYVLGTWPFLGERRSPRRGREGERAQHVRARL